MRDFEIAHQRISEIVQIDKSCAALVHDLCITYHECIMSNCCDFVTYCTIDGRVGADRLYFVTLKKKPRSSPAVHYFATDDEFVYNR